MTQSTISTALRLTAVAALSVSMTACGSLTRLSEVGNGPQLSQIQNPMADPNYQKVSMPMPTPALPEHNPNSLWRAGAKAFFKDHRAKEVGDLVTVKLTIDDKANLQNETTRDRNDSESANVTNLLGLENEFTKVLPQGLNPAAAANFGNTHSTDGDGEIDRSEEINTTLAAIVIQILPNGNLVIAGRQEIRVNSELRELRVTGIIRPTDIDPSNTIDHTKIAEMRVAYGGRGSLSDLQSPRWGTQIWDIVFPF
jgi:flagellar L-ring protein precursor FlgH